MIYGTDNVSEKPLAMQVTQNRVTAADSLGPNDGPVTDWEDHWDPARKRVESSPFMSIP